MFPFPAALISKEPDFCFLVPKKTVERIRVVFTCGVRFPAKTQLQGNCFPPQAWTELRASEQTLEDSAASLHPSLLPSGVVMGLFHKGVLAAECLSQLREVLRFNWGNRKKQECLGTKIENRNLVLISCCQNLYHASSVPMEVSCLTQGVKEDVDQYRKQSVPPLSFVHINDILMRTCFLFSFKIQSYCICI